MRGIRKKADSHLKQKAIIKLKMGIAPDTPEKKLWFAVLEQAVKDIGKREKKWPHLKHYWNSDSFFTFRTRHNLMEIADYLDTDRDYILKMIEQTGIWPLPYDYYI